jgi:hypothetical protein
MVLRHPEILSDALTGDVGCVNSPVPECRLEFNDQEITAEKMRSAG